MTALRDAATAYAGRDLPIFPIHAIVNGRCGCGARVCPDVGKHPAEKGWQKSIASVRAAESIWRDTGPERGIGLACGSRAGCFVVDIDPRHGGNEALNELLHQHGPMSGTWAAQSGSGGLHLFFAYPDDGEVRNSAGKIGPGIDVRGAGGFVVLPPSRHASGSRYRWLSPPDTLDLAPAPDWLLDRIRAESRPTGQRARVPAPMVAAGRRHDALVSLLGVMRRWGACEEVLDAAAVAFVKHQCLDDDPSTPINWAKVHADARDIARRY
ncbi:MAG: bifunctional DNA primase/polymerase [Solirubrobacteraceae bacterium]